MAKSSEYELAIKIAGKVDSSLKSAAKNAKGELGSLSATAKNAFKGIAVAAAAITTAAVAAGKALYDLGTEFDSAYDTIRIGTGATGEALEDLKGSMRDVYASVPTDMASAANAIADYNTRLGLTGEGLETLSKQALQVSEMLDEDLGGVIEASSQSFRIFGLDAGQMAGSMDWLFKVSQSTGIGFTELTALVQRNGAAFQQMGFTYDESAAMLGRLEKAGYETSTVMTAMTYAVKASANMGLKGKAAYEQYYDSIRNAKDETEAISLAMELFGSRSGTVMAQAIRDGTLAMDDFMGELAASSETIGAAAEDAYDLAEKWTMFTNKMKVALEPMATTLFDSVNDVVTALLPTVEALMPVITGLVAAILPTATKLLKSLVPIVEKFASAILPPVVSLLDKLLPPLMQIVDAVLPVITSLIEALAPILSTLITALQPVFDILTQILPPITSIIAKLSPIISLIGELVAQIINFLSPAITFISEVISSVLQVAFDTIGPMIEGVMGIFSGLIDFLTNVFEGDWGGAWEAIVGVFGGIWEGITDLFKAPINAVISMLNWFIGQINSISIGPLPDWKILGEYAGAEIGFNISEIAYLAKGGIVTEPTVSMVGEGSEPEAVLPLSKLVSMLDRMGGDAIANNDNTTNQSESIVFSPVFNFYGGAADKEQAEEAGRVSFAEFKHLYQQMKSEERRKSFRMA